MTEFQREKFDMLTLHKVLICIFGCMFLYDYYHTTTPVVVRIRDPKFSILGPDSVNEIVVNDTYDQLIDIRNFSFKINPQTCRDYPAGLLLVVLVASRPTNFKNRMVIRSTWGRSVDSTKVVFLMGETNKPKIEQQIRNESQMYGDIVQGNFADAYRNMTYKHVMALKWVVHHCPTAKYILKTDDDMVVNSHELRRFLAKELSPWGTKGLITCQVLEHAQAQRSNKSKWRVSLTEFSAQYYPTYCAGWAILYSQDVVPRLLATAQSLPYFWIDDVHITGICAQMIGVARTPLSSLILNKHRTNLLTMFGPDSVGQFLFGPPDLNLDKINTIWKAIPE
ncbi:beta-1,3-galactosyltransferase 5-like [Ostrinia nubilalis]|uniref:beta-1,3-galactosyltransferase 5-like n=1 Tax=Ostrinia furnacalis TaxID=93504 RepID=UPI00103C34A6|nr:beta-1,3-galactosyltransferase 5-like [Ostrinia furnacalis]